MKTGQLMLTMMSVTEPQFVMGKGTLFLWNPERLLLHIGE